MNQRAKKGPRMQSQIEQKRTNVAPPSPPVKTAAEARADFDRRGKSIAQWAREHNVSSALVMRVLSGNRACFRGQSHKIAVLLGMKHGEITHG